MKPGSPAARSLESKSSSALHSSVEHLLEEAARHLDLDELAEYDLDKEADVARLRALIARLQAETARFAFGYSIQVRGEKEHSVQPRKNVWGLRWKPRSGNRGNFLTAIIARNKLKKLFLTKMTPLPLHRHRRR